MNVNVIEAVWISLNLSTLILTVSALLDALADRSAVRRLNGQARELAAGGIVRREAFRAVVQALLLAAVIPGTMAPGEATLSFTVAALMAVPVLLLTSSLLDARERKAMTILVAVEMLSERVGSLARVEAQNADLADAMLAQGASAAAIEATVEDTHTKVDEIHRVTVDGQP